MTLLSRLFTYFDTETEYVLSFTKNSLQLPFNYLFKIHSLLKNFYLGAIFTENIYLKHFSTIQGSGVYNF